MLAELDRLTTLLLEHSYLIKKLNLQLKNTFVLKKNKSVSKKKNVI